jgi:Fe2+ or Zn2+ uptake regulation protein
MGPGRAEEIERAVRLRLDERQVRFTPRRRRLVEVLAAATRPVTIAEISAQAPDLAVSSTYRNLVVLEGAGVVHRIVTGDDFARFELAEDLTGHHHHHLVCTACGSVEDLHASPELEAAVAVAAARARRRGFDIEGHRLDLLGRCPACRRSAATVSATGR